MQKITSSSILLIIFKITTIQSTSSIILSCQPSYLLIKPISDFINLSTSSSKCSLRKKNQLIFDTNCLNDNSSLLIQSAPKFIETENPQIFRTTCSDVINDYSTFQQKIVKMNVREMDEALTIDILIFNQTIIDNRSLYPTLCQMMDEEKHIIPLSDKSGCPLEDNFNKFNVSNIGNHRLFSSKIQLNYAMSGSIRLQCSLVPCGMNCLKPCPHERQSFGFANQQILSQTVQIATKQQYANECDFQLLRISLILLLLFLVILTTFMIFMAYRMFPKTHLIQTIHMLKHLYKTEKRSQKIQIVHPFDHFSSPPVITNESVASIKANLIKSDFQDKKQMNNYENDHLDINELERCQTNSTEIYLTPSILDSLPDPPSISIKDLKRTILINERKEKIQLPQPIPRWSSTVSEALYAVPPPPPNHSNNQFVTNPTFSCSDHSTISNISSIRTNSSLNGFAMIDDEIEFNTLDKPLAQQIAQELHHTFCKFNQPFDHTEIEF